MYIFINYMTFKNSIFNIYVENKLYITLLEKRASATVFSDGLIPSLISDGSTTDMPRKNSSDGSATELRLKINKKENFNFV